MRKNNYHWPKQITKSLFLLFARRSLRLLEKHFAPQKWNFLNTDTKLTQNFGNKIMQTVKHYGCDVAVRDCFATSGPVVVSIIDGIKNSELDQKILKENIWPSVFNLNFSCIWFFFAGRWSKVQVHQEKKKCWKKFWRGLVYFRCGWTNNSLKKTGKKSLW